MLEMVPKGSAAADQHSWFSAAALCHTAFFAVGSVLQVPGKAAMILGAAGRKAALGLLGALLPPAAHCHTGTEPRSCKSRSMLELPIFLLKTQ